MPRLQEKIIDAGMINGADGGAGVGICGKQRPLRAGEDAHCLLQEFHSVHARHALIGKQQGHTVIANLQLLQKIERAFGRITSDDPIFSSVLRAKIALDRPQNIRVVIHTQQYWFRHSSFALRPPQGITCLDCRTVSLVAQILFSNIRVRRFLSDSHYRPCVASKAARPARRSRSRGIISHATAAPPSDWPAQMNITIRNPNTNAFLTDSLMRVLVAGSSPSGACKPASLISFL